MRRVHVLLLCALAALFCLSNCQCARKGALNVEGGELITYRCEGGEQIIARYYSLSDKSLYFVKLTLPDGQEFTLPNVMSASGARYTDDRLWVWWTKGETGFAETRDENGEWQVKYQNCQQVSAK